MEMFGVSSKIGNANETASLRATVVSRLPGVVGERGRRERNVNAQEKNAYDSAAAGASGTGSFYIYTEGFKISKSIDFYVEYRRQ